MTFFKAAISSAGLALALAAATPASAAMTFPQRPIDASVQKVECAFGFKLGDVGGCVIGTPDRRHVERDVVEHRAVDDGCVTRSTHTDDSDGNSETRTVTHCD